jgi:hypothetical protein
MGRHETALIQKNTKQFLLHLTPVSPTQNRDFSKFFFEQPVHISIGNNNKLFVKPLIIYITTG